MPIEDDNLLRSILTSARTIAVVGASNKPYRDSNRITDLLIHRGFAVYPVNPAYAETNGVKCHPDLRSIQRPIDIVNVFRNPAALKEIVDDAIAVKAKTLWLQYGVVNEVEAERAERAGIQVVMDHCIAVDLGRLVRR